MTYLSFKNGSRFHFSRSRRGMMVGSKPCEASLVEAILNMLNIPTICPETFAWRMETDGKPRRNPDGSFRLVRNKYGRGKPDICGIKAGHGFVMEVKMPGQSAEPHQKEWLQDYQERGRGHAFVVHSVDEAMDYWRMI